MTTPPSPDRRRFLGRLTTGALALAAVPLLAPARAWAEANGGATRALRLHNLHTQESGTFVFRAGGERVPTVLADLQRFFRDFRTGQDYPLDPALYDLLHEVAVTADRTPEYEVICGYRSPQTNEALRGRSANTGVAKHSLHLQGMAVDVRMPGLGIRQLRDHGWALQRGGVGLYTSSQFVHFDTGRVRQWGA